MLGRGRGGPRWDGTVLFRREVTGDVILGMEELAAGTSGGPGNFAVRAGEAGRAMQERAETAGLAGRGIPPALPIDGESGCMLAFTNRATCDGGAGT